MFLEGLSYICTFGLFNAIIPFRSYFIYEDFSEGGRGQGG